MQLSQELPRLLVALIFCCGFLSGLAGQEAKLRSNDAGEKFLVYPDGRVTYFNGDPVDPETAAQFTTIAVEIEPLSGPVDITQDDVYRIALRRTQLAKQAAEIARLRATEATANRERIEQALTTATEPERKRALQRQLTLARRLENESKREALAAQKEHVRSAVLTTKGGYVADYNQRVRQRRELEVQHSAAAGYAPATTVPTPLAYQRSDSWSSRTDFSTHPPTLPCPVVAEGIDEQTGEYTKRLGRQLLFTHTDDRLRPYLKDKAYLRCEGYLYGRGGYRFVALEFTFAYPNAREAYGLIEKNSVLTIRMLDGSFVNLRAGRMDHGSYDTQREVLTYRVFYPIDRGQIATLRSGDLDYIRVFWSSGYEEYEIFQTDFFRQQLECLE
jgi:hypothetical protein